jgi:hypothetical protein
LVDTTLELHEANGPVVTNDNWRDTQEAEIIATTIPPTDNLESAIVATLPPGGHTAVLRGKNGATGVGLVEVYDLDQSAGATIANISTRGFVDTGDNVMIGGIIVGGASPGLCVVRALGPSLAAAGIGDPLPDPVLQLYNADGTVIAFNDDWGVNTLGISERRQAVYGDCEIISRPDRKDREGRRASQSRPLRRAGFGFACCNLRGSARTWPILRRRFSSASGMAPPLGFRSGHTHALPGFGQESHRPSQRAGQGRAGRGERTARMIDRS